MLQYIVNYKHFSISCKVYLKVQNVQKSCRSFSWHMFWSSLPCILIPNVPYTHMVCRIYGMSKLSFLTHHKQVTGGGGEGSS